jgi:hypothetical protein
MKNRTHHFFEKQLSKTLLLLALFMAPLGLLANCDCYTSNIPCDVEIQYIDYTPWEAGDDAGLWCLPGSTCTYAIPTRPTGAEIYQDLSHLAHNSRYPIEYTPEQWRTIMMHMRVLLPMTAWDYRSTLAFIQGRQLKKAELTTANEGANDISKEMAVTNNTKSATAKQDDLLEEIGPVSTVPEVASLPPTPSFSYKSKFSYVFTGFLDAYYYAPTFSFFGDFEGNNTFSYSFAPLFLVSYAESVILIAKIGVFNFGQAAYFELPYAYLAYIYNDYLTFVAGKFVIPLGNYYTIYFNSWIDKSATKPVFRVEIEFFQITPIIEIGFEVKGAIPLCLLINDCWFKHSSVTYDLWIGNGPSEVNDFTPFTALYPNGSIYFGASANAPNNNNEFTWGCRFSFLPSDLDCFGVSYMRGRWSSNKVAFSADGLGKKRVYQAACFDWNMNFNPSIVFRGEYIWTQYEGNLPQFPWVRQTAYWAAISSGFDILAWICPDIYCWKPCLWDSLELVLRSEAQWSQPSGQASLGKLGGGFDYSGFDRKRFSVTLGYYFTQTFTAKVEYAHNYGDKGLNFLREAITGSSKKTGFANDVFTFKVVWGF